MSLVLQIDAKLERIVVHYKYWKEKLIFKRKIIATSRDCCYGSWS